MPRTGRVIFVNRYFYPDQSATARLLSDLAFALAESDGVAVHVVTSRQLIDAARARLPAHEVVRGVAVHRVWSTAGGRARLGRRALDYLTFHLAARRRVLALAGTGDVVVAKTDPPMLSVSLAGASARRGARLLTWLQDLFPEVAEALGVIPRGGWLARRLARLRDRSLAAADANVVLGEAMAAVLRARGVAAERIHVIPNWADGAAIGVRGDAARRLRAAWGLSDDFVVGYCGNLGRVHEFDTLLDAAALLAAEPGVRFVLVGAGARRGALLDGVRSRGLRAVRVLPPQPESQLAALLAAMDVHVVCLDGALEGLVVPSKIYGVLAAGRPVLNVGKPGAELSTLVETHGCGTGVANGDAPALAGAIRALAGSRRDCEQAGRRARALFEARFDRPRAHAAWRAVLAGNGSTGG